MTLEPDRLRRAYETARDQLLSECVACDGQPAHWYGELSTSALSTATAVMALAMVRRAGRSAQDFEIDAEFDGLIRGGLEWLASHQNEDGGWGDTVKSISNISTTMLSHAVFHATETVGEFQPVVDKAKAYIDDAGGVPAVVARYGKDKTFSIPILTHCALAGLVEWSEVSSLPFELACIPARFYKTVRLPVVSYALPALIAIGQVRFHHRPTWNPITRLLRKLAIKPSLRVLERIQPPNGGFLEAAPLTSFVTMSLAGKGLVDHIVVRRAVKFLCDSARDDGSWPIDTNLATWVTTLSINALGEDVPRELREGLLEWLLGQQYREVHPFTNADPGGWAWTDLPGGVPDADDTPGAMLALHSLQKGGTGGLSASVEQSDAQRLPDKPPVVESVGSDESHASRREARTAITNGIEWLVGLQNRDGGFPTFCRGWGQLPFDRSSPDITAHCVRAIVNVTPDVARMMTHFDERGRLKPKVRIRSGRVLRRCRHVLAGLQFLRDHQRPNGSWVPLWFGNQFATNDENPVYGTARVLMAYRDLQQLDSQPAQRAATWLASIQAPNSETQTAGSSSRGWGGDAGIEPSVEETALASEVLLEFDQYRSDAFDGIRWLIDRVESGSLSETTPIGFYFARLWYFERLYPLIFAVSALRRAVEIVNRTEV